MTYSPTAKSRCDISGSQAGYATCRLSLSPAPSHTAPNASWDNTDSPPELKKRACLETNHRPSPRDSLLPTALYTTALSDSDDNRTSSTDTAGPPNLKQKSVSFVTASCYAFFSKFNPTT